MRVMEKPFHYINPAFVIFESLERYFDWGIKNTRIKSYSYSESLVAIVSAVLKNIKTIYLRQQLPINLFHPPYHVTKAKKYNHEI